MHWIVLAPFVGRTPPPDGWLQPYVKGHRLDMVEGEDEPGNWHLKAKARTGLQEWMAYARHTLRGLRRRQGGVITLFPQLASVAGLVKLLTFGRYPIVAHFYNTNPVPGLRAVLARLSARAIDVFVVHTTAEIEVYARWLGVPRERIVFVPLQKPDFTQPVPGQDADREPFVFATGSGHRDYATFFEAVAGLPFKVVCAPGRHAIAGLTVPANVEIRFEISRQELLLLSQLAAVNVIPMTDSGPTAGYVTIVESLRMGNAMVVTDRPGIDDYVQHGKTALLVPLRDPSAMRQAILDVMQDPALAARLRANARAFGQDHCSDPAAGAALEHILDALAEQHAPRRAARPSALPPGSASATGF